MKKIKQQLRYYWLHREAVIGIVVIILILLAGLALVDHLINESFK
jgi:hypothetical protein